MKTIPIQTEAQAASPVPILTPKSILLEAAKGCRKVALEYADLFESTTDKSEAGFDWERAKENLLEARRLEAEASA